MSINPIAASAAIEESYKNYLATTFRFGDVNLQQQFIEQLSKPERLLKGPILEATPYFKSGNTIESLIEENVLSEGFRNLRTSALPLDRSLYKHQESAIRKVIEKQRNIVVSTGTGSGKTETFMIPIINHLMREWERGELQPGVRALLLYPMNALANDQMVRLRSLLKNFPDITFGRYTGETEKEYRNAVDQYRNMFHSDPLPNELICRQQMWDNPPHILITNYAMLEYLLLRPDDSVFFDGRYSGNWCFIVIDEVHTYSGSKGIEMAMLLRRLKDRVIKDPSKRLQCIATSATLGKGKEDYAQIVNFASQMFGEPFEWIENDSRRQDVIEGERMPLTQAVISWGHPDERMYQQWLDVIDNDSTPQDIVNRLASIALDSQVPEVVVNHAIKEAEEHDWRRFIYSVLKADARLINLQKELQEGPKLLTSIAEKIVGNSAKAMETLVCLVELASRAKEDDSSLPLLPARYHVFARAIEGAYLGMMPDMKLYLERHEFKNIEGTDYAIFEIATCNQCASLYLVGKSLEENGVTYLRQSSQEIEAMEYYLMKQEDFVPCEADEDDEINFPEISQKKQDLSPYILCGKCGAIEKQGFMGKICHCKDSKYFTVYKVPTSSGGRIYVCPACGRRSPRGVVRRFLTGNDATASVLSTALYQQINPQKVTEPAEDRASGERDEWNLGAYEMQEKSSHEGTRKLLIFSDSRQDAAFFAPYLNHTYNQILRRSLIIKTLKDYKGQIIENKWRIQNLADALYKTADEAGIFEQSSIQDNKNEVYKWLFYEFLGLNKRNSLEALGLIHFSLVKPKYWRAPPPLLRSPWNMTEEEVWTLFQVLLDTFRNKGAVLFPEWISPRDEFFQPRNREFYFRGNQTCSKRGILSWNTDRLNGRLDYIIRVAKNLNPTITKEECIELLKTIWDRCLLLGSPNSVWGDHFHAKNLTGEGVVYQIGNHVWEIASPLVHDDIQWYICDTCNTITPYNIRGTCVSYQCTGKLHSCDPLDVFEDNHYYRLYMETKPIKMYAEEHTAQLTSQSAAELQTKFVNGEVNILSCSTTFELGIDVGELEAVFMRNMPPSAANYIQRAGRAGRRADSAAFVLTFAQRKSHDITHYHEPWRMVAGEIRAPYITLDNEKIILRHIFATALSKFWAENNDYFGNVESFFFHAGRPGPEKLKQYLKSKPPALYKSLKRIVPRHMHDLLEDWKWVDLLLGEDGVMVRAYEELKRDVEEIEAAREEAYKQYRDGGHLIRLLNTIKTRPLLSFMSSRSIIPKYGFPVDVVPLQIDHHGEEAKRLQLERDLKIALSEYAPSSQIVAAGKLWTSRYIKRVPTKAWERYRYVICANCRSYHRTRAELLKKNDNPFPRCPACGHRIAKADGDFIIPSFGFIASTDAPGRPGEQRPEKTYTTRVYYSGEANESLHTELELGNVLLTATAASHGKLAVINTGGQKRFKICYSCGYALLGDEKTKSSHKTNWGRECRGKLQSGLSLGHEFETDILKLYFDGYGDSREGFWLSLLYALLEGASEALQIERQDLDGCLYPIAGNPERPALILFDNVPGGAGHVKRMANKTILKEVLYTTLERLKRCECGGEDGNASCYGCLRHYYNEFCHDVLNRGMVIDFLSKILPLDTLQISLNLKGTDVANYNLL